MGTRTEAVTLVALEEGEYLVPGIELQWWDVNAARMRTETVPAISFVVLPAVTEAAFELAVDSAEAEAAAGEAAPRVDLLGLLRRYGLWLLALVAVVWTGMRTWRRHGARWVAAVSDAELAKAYEALTTLAYGEGAKETKWDSATLLTAVSRARKHLTTPLGHVAGASLPPLNPTASA